MVTFRGVVTGAITCLLVSTGLVASATATAVPPPSAPYTAFTMTFSGWGYLDGSFSYESSRNTVEAYPQTTNGYGLVLRGFRDGGWHYVQVTPVIGTRFVAGTTYSTVVSFAPSSTSTIINVMGDGEGCGAGPPGTLAVAEAQYDDATGLLTAFAASYSTPCYLSDITAKGEIRYQSSLGYKAVDNLQYRMFFGEQPVGAGGTPRQINVPVFGTLPTTFGAASLSGVTPAAFEISANTCSGNTFSYGESCTLTITPRATAIGEQTAILTLAEDSVAGSIRRQLLLDGIDARDASLSPSFLDFGYVPAYDTSPPMTVTVTGTGLAPITFGQGSLVGENPGMFRVTSDLCSGSTLANGQSCTVTAVARPDSVRGGGAIFSLPDNSAAGSTPISLYVNGYTTDRGTYYPMSPYRILDTRQSSGLVQPGGVIHLDLASGGVPAEASTVVLNVTVTSPSGHGHISVYPTGVPRPTVSSLNYTPNWTGANSVTVKVGANGQVDLYNSAGTVHIIVDVFGYYSKGRACCSGYMGGQYHPLSSPVRLADTRTWNVGRVPGGAYIQAAASWNTTVNPRVRAFAVNVTATEPVGPGYLTAWNGYAHGLPNTSTLNYVAGSTVPNFAIVPAVPCDQCGIATGWPSIGVFTSNASHIIVDIVGYYDDGSLPDGLRFEPIVPTRIVDTRARQGWPSALGPNSTATITAPAAIAGDDTWALATNVTAVQPTQNTFLTVWPADLPGVGKPGTSNLNPVAGSIVPNAVQTMIGLGNGFHVYNNAGTCHVVIDVVGRFEQYPPSPPPDWPNTSQSAMAQYRITAGDRRLSTAPIPSASPSLILIKNR